MICDVVAYRNMGREMKKLTSQMETAMQMVVVLPMRGRNGYMMAKYLSVQNRSKFVTYKYLSIRFIGPV